MLSIVLAHIFSFLHIYTYQLFSLAVNVFLFLSGYLYSNKEIKIKSFLLNRLKKIILPFWLVGLFIYLYLIFIDNNFKDFYQIFITLFNLQGIKTIFINLKLNFVLCPSSLSHCWFLTVIFFSYIIMLGFKKSKIEKNIEEKPFLFLIISMLLQIIFAYCGFQPVLIICFFLGYFWGKYIGNNKALSKWKFISITIVTFIICLLRLITRKFIDGTFIYDGVIAGWSFNFLAMWIFIFIDLLCKKWSLLIYRICQSFIWQTLEKLSYPIYLVHYMFLKQPLCVSNYIHSSKSIQILIFLVLTIITATFLFFVCEFFDKKMLKKQNSLKLFNLLKSVKSM